MKPIAWYDPSNGMVSTDQDCALFTPLGQVWPLYPEHEGCPQCEYHKNRAAMWRAEAYVQAGHDIIERPWVGLTDEELAEFSKAELGAYDLCLEVEAKLKEKNQ
jgi:hypothetical protein